MSQCDFGSALLQRGIGGRSGSYASCSTNHQMCHHSASSLLVMDLDMKCCAFPVHLLLSPQVRFIWTVKDWMDVVPFHSALEAFPVMGPSDYACIVYATKPSGQKVCTSSKPSPVGRSSTAVAGRAPVVRC